MSARSPPTGIVSDRWPLPRPPRRAPCHSGSQALHKFRRLLRRGRVEQVLFEDCFDQSDDGIPELPGIGQEMLGGQVDDIAQRIDCRLQGFDRHERRLTFFDGFFHPEARDRTRLGNIRADQEQSVGGDNVFECDGPPVGALHPSQGLHPADMSIPSAAVDVIGPDHLAHEFLKHDRGLRWCNET